MSGQGFRVGQNVAWHWGNGEGEGKIAERFEREVSRTIKGSKEDPAFLIEQDDGGKVLKLASELSHKG